MCDEESQVKTYAIEAGIALVSFVVLFVLKKWGTKKWKSWRGKDDDEQKLKNQAQKELDGSEML